MFGLSWEILQKFKDKTKSELFISYSILYLLILFGAFSGEENGIKYLHSFTK